MELQVEQHLLLGSVPGSLVLGFGLGQPRTWARGHGLFFVVAVLAFRSLIFLANSLALALSCLINSSFISLSWNSLKCSALNSPAILVLGSSALSIPVLAILVLMILNSLSRFNLIAVGLSLWGILGSSVSWVLSSFSSNILVTPGSLGWQAGYL